MLMCPNGTSWLVYRHSHFRSDQSSVPYNWNGMIILAMPARYGLFKVHRMPAYACKLKR